MVVRVGWVRVRVQGTTMASCHHWDSLMATQTHCSTLYGIHTLQELNVSFEVLNLGLQSTDHFLLQSDHVSHIPSPAGHTHLSGHHLMYGLVHGLA